MKHTNTDIQCIDIYVLMYACSYGPLAWCLPAELWSNAKRAKGVGIATATVWWANTVIGITVPSMVIHLGWGTYLFFGCFCFAASIFSYFDTIAQAPGGTFRRELLLVGQSITRWSFHCWTGEFEIGRHIRLTETRADLQALARGKDFMK